MNMSNKLSSLTFGQTDELTSVTCPVCGMEYVHLVGTLTQANNLVVIIIRCENDHFFDIVFKFRRGNILVAADAIK